MEEVMTISKIPHADLAFDYEGLRSKGIEHIRDTASAIWTDHNIHDPGITSLEILCYAITDLSYRGSYSIPDLLRRKDNHAVDIIQSFLTAKKIFPNKALTINDYRKLLINIEGVKNVWLRKRSRSLVADLTNKKLVFSVPAGSTTSAVDIKGYYEVLLEFDTTIKTPEDQIKLINEARTLLNANRNLAEDFHEIRKVDQQSFRLCCEIEMKPDADATETMADIFFKIQLHLSPLVRFYSLQQLHGDRNEKFTTDRIFEGPFISKGFIKIKELVASELKNEIHLSDLMQLILDKDEVNNVTEILFNDVNQQTELENRWVIPVNKGFQPVVDILQSNIVIYKNGMPVRLNKPAIKLQYDKLMDDYLKQNENMKSEDLRFDTGRYRQVEQYHSIQHHFPKTYGISHWGLPPEVTVERQKQAKQLQGYLLLFDQLMADYLAQLSSLGNLFSTADEKNTFFTQLVKDFKDPSWLYSSYSEILSGGKIDEEKSWKNSVSRIQDIAEQKGSPQFYKRRNLFLDHLLSRFAESFYDYINIYISHFPGQATDEKIVELKRKFLQDYPEYSANRACAYNYALADHLWNEADNISGFEKRVQRLLGFENISRRSLVNLYSEIKEEESGGVKTYSFNVIDNVNAKTLLTADEKFPDKEKAQQELQIALALCSSADSMKVTEDTTDNTFRIEVRDKLNTLMAVGNKGTKAAAAKDKKRITDLLKNMAGEGMFLIENLLLFDKSAGEYLPICTDPNCNECNDTDPYSFRISIVIPAYAPRFLDMEFRSYVEQTMREEMPAHLLVKICWVSNEDLHELEESYKDWLQLKAGLKEDTDNNILKRFISILTSLKSIYPESNLQNCNEDELRQLFVLNKNSLGTQKSS